MPRGVYARKTATKKVAKKATRKTSTRRVRGTPEEIPTISRSALQSTITPAGADEQPEIAQGQPLSNVQYVVFNSDEYGEIQTQHGGSDEPVAVENSLSLAMDAARERLREYIEDEGDDEAHVVIMQTVGFVSAKKSKALDYEVRGAVSHDPA